MSVLYIGRRFLKVNPLKAELNSICHLLALLGAHHVLHVSEVRVNVSFTAVCPFGRFLISCKISPIFSTFYNYSHTTFSSISFLKATSN